MKTKRSHKKIKDPIEINTFLLDHSIELTEEAKSFLGLDAELFTDQLFQELILKGWPEKELIDFRAKGWRYSRKRNSFFSPKVETEWYENEK